MSCGKTSYIELSTDKQQFNPQGNARVNIENIHSRCILSRGNLNSEPVQHSALKYL